MKDPEIWMIRPQHDSQGKDYQIQVKGEVINLDGFWVEQMRI
jgi:hypothetical protein